MAISTNSLWLESRPKTNYPHLGENIDCDVVIIGGGIAGLTTAYLLANTNLRVVLLEKDTIGSGATGYTTAMITQYIDTDISDLVRIYGSVYTKHLWESGTYAINTIEKIIKKERIKCEFMRCPYYVYATSEKQFKSLEEEKESATDSGITLSFAPPPKLPTTSYKLLTIPNQAKFHPIQYVNGLAHAAGEKGVRIFEKTEVLEIEEKHVKTKNCEVLAKNIVVATYQPLDAPFSLLFKKGLYKTYMITAKIPKDKFPEALFSDLQSPYHYFRIDRQKTFDRIMIGGEDHRSQIPVSEEKSFSRLEDYLKKIVNGDKYTITHKWSGPILEPTDGLPSIGPVSDSSHIYYATGFSGNGMTYGTLAGSIISDLINLKKNKFYEMYRENRPLNPKALVTKAFDYTQEFWEGAVKNVFRK